MSEYDVVLPESDGDDEVMSSGGLPRWLGFVAALAVAALLAALVRQGLSGGDHTAAPTSTDSRTSPPPGPSANFAWDLAKSAGGTWLLESTSLAQVSGTRVARSVALRGLVVQQVSVPKLAVDAAANRVWIVLTNAALTRMIEFDAVTLQRIRTVTWSHLVQGAAALRGYLFLSTDFGIAELAPGASRPRYVPGLAGSIGPVVVDAARGRIVTMDLGYPTDIWTYRPGSRPHEAETPLPLENGTIAVVGGQIWVGGSYESGRAVLLRLDPRTLQPVQQAPASEFGPEAVIAGTGAKVLWLRTADSSNLLACVNATTGRVEQRWRVISVNAVASDRSGALVATPSGVLGLVLSGCAG